MKNGYLREADAAQNRGGRAAEQRQAEQRRQCCEKKIVEREQMRFWLIFWL
jgi:hypothetical protein